MASGQLAVLFGCGCGWVAAAVTAAAGAAAGAATPKSEAWPRAVAIRSGRVQCVQTSRKGAS